MCACGIGDLGRSKGPKQSQLLEITGKWTVTIAASAYIFISPISTSIVAPAQSSIGTALHIQSEFVLWLCLSIFILAYAFGQFLTGPLSEVYGRYLVLQLANLFYPVFKTACGFAHNTTQMVVFRFLAGLGGRHVYRIGFLISKPCKMLANGQVALHSQ